MTMTRWVVLVTSTPRPTSSRPEAVGYLWGLGQPGEPVEWSNKVVLFPTKSMAQGAAADCFAGTRWSWSVIPEAEAGPIAPEPTN